MTKKIKIKIVFFLLLSLHYLTNYLYSQEVSVSLFNDRKVQGITLTVQKGSYLVYDGKNIVDTLEIGVNVNILKESDYIVYRNRSKAFATDKDLVLLNRGEASFF